MKNLMKFLAASAAAIGFFALLLLPNAQTLDASAAGGDHVHCVCGGNISNEAKTASGHVCDGTQVWTAWDGSINAIKSTDGYYYLTKDVTWTEQCTFTGNTKVHICLNGYTITRAGTVSATSTHKFFLMGYNGNNGGSNALDICDCSAEQTGQMVWASNVVHHDAFAFIQGFSKGTNVNTINLWGGKLGAATISTSKTSAGMISLGRGYSLNIYGGEYHGANFYNAERTAFIGNGGFVFAEGKAEIAMYGGTVIGGHCNQGGAFYLGTAYLNMYGGTIRDGIAENAGGNIYEVWTSGDLSSGFWMHGGEVTGGTAKNNGGNLSGSNGSVFVLNDGKITHGTINPTDYVAWYSSNSDFKNNLNGTGGNICLQGNSSFTMNGGEVSYGTINASGAAIALGGNIGAQSFLNSGSTSPLAPTLNINGGVIKNGRIYCTSGTKEDTVNSVDNNLVAGANIGFGGLKSGSLDKSGTCNIKGGTITLDTDTDQNGKRLYGVIYAGNITQGSKYVKGGNIYNGTQKMYITATATSPVVISNGYCESNYWQAGGNIGNFGYMEITGPVRILNGSFSGNGTLDGGNIYSYGGIYIKGATLSGGRAKNGGNFSGEGPSSGSTAYGVTITDTVMENGTATQHGGNIRIAARMKATLDGNTQILNGTANNKGGNILIDGQLSLCQMIIKGNTVIKGGFAKNDCGGNIAVHGVLTIEGGEISEGIGRNGGNIWINIADAISKTDSYGRVTMTGGYIHDGATYDYATDKIGTRAGGNLSFNGGYVASAWRIPGQFYMSGGTIEQTLKLCTYKTQSVRYDQASSNGANISGSGYIEMTGGEIKGGNSTGIGGSIYLSALSKASYPGFDATKNQTKFEITGGKITGGKSGATTLTSGGNIYVGPDHILTIGGTAEISDGYATRGGNIFSEGIVNLQGSATVQDGYATIEGGNLYLYTTCETSFTGGTVKDGEAETAGGNVFIGITTTFNGTAFSGGTAKNGGNVYLNSGNTLTVTGSTVLSGGTANASNGNGGNLYVASNAIANVQSGTLSNGSAYMGGNIYSTGTLSVTGGTLTGGAAANNGGNLRTAGGTTTISGGVFSNGTASVYSEADNVFFVNTNVSISGGEFLNDSTTKPNVWIHNGCPQVSVTGGYFSGIFHGKEGDRSLAKGACVTGGYFVNAPDAYVLAEGYAAFPLNPTVTQNEVTYHYEVLPGSLILLSSRTTVTGSNQTNGSLALLSGGGLVSAGASVTLETTVPEGYEFVGWWKDAYTGNAASTNTTYALGTVSADASYIAVFRMLKNAGKETLVSYSFTGTEFTLKIGSGEAATYTGTKSGTVPAGTELLVNYLGEGFLSWKNSNEKMVSRTSEYGFTAYVDTALTATVADDSSVTVVTFISATNQIVKRIETASALTASDLPEIPARFGFTGGQWNKTLAQINAAIADPEKAYIDVKAGEFTESTVSRTITLKQAILDNGTWTVKGTDTVYNETDGKLLTLTAAGQISGIPTYGFQYFATGSAAAPNVLSYNSEFVLQVSNDLTVYAVYVRTEDITGKEPTITVTMNTATETAAGIYTLSIGVTRDLPEGFELVEQGILFTKNNPDIVYGGTGVMKALSNGVNDCGITILNIRKVPEGNTIYARGYIIVRKADDPTTDTDILYTELAACTAE